MATQSSTAEVTNTRAQWIKRFNPLTNKKGKVTRRRTLSTIIIVAAIIVAAIFGVKYNNAQNRADQLSSDPQAAAKAAVQTTVDRVGKLVALPTNETPTLATVNDATKLKSQAFFSKAENGDKVLIYVKARVAVLYRPEINKVINIAPLNIGSSSTGQ